MPVTFRALPQRQKVVDLASRQSNQKQIYHFLYSARHFLGCAGVRFSRGQVPQTYSSEAAARGKPERSAQAAPGRGVRMRLYKHIGERRRGTAIAPPVP